MRPSTRRIATCWMSENQVFVRWRFGDAASQNRGENRVSRRDCPRRVGIGRPRSPFQRWSSRRPTPWQRRTVPPGTSITQPINREIIINFTRWLTLRPRQEAFQAAASMRRFAYRWFGRSVSTVGCKACVITAVACTISSAPCDVSSRSSALAQRPTALIGPSTWRTADDGGANRLTFAAARENCSMAGHLRTRGPSVKPWVFPHLVAWLESHRLDVAKITRLSGIVTNDPDRRVSETTAETAWRLAATMTKTSPSGCASPSGFRRVRSIEHAVRSSRSLASGLERLARDGCLVSDSCRRASRIARPWAAADHPRRRFVGAAPGTRGVRAGAQAETRPRCHGRRDRTGTGRLRSSSPRRRVGASAVLPCARSFRCQDQYDDRQCSRRGAATNRSGRQMADDDRLLSSHRLVPNNRAHECREGFR
jgi:hypothetical protein